MCNILDIPIKGGSSKKAQMKYIDQYCDFIKHPGKNSFTIKLHEFRPMEDGRGKSDGSRGNNSIYGTLVQESILSLLTKDKPLITTRNRLMMQIGMINKNYQKYYNEPLELARALNVNVEIVYDFYGTSNSNTKGIIERVLKALVSKKLITYYKIPMVAPTLGGHREATDEELRIIGETTHKVLEEMGYGSTSVIRGTSEWSKFENRRDYILRERHGINYSYQAYEITQLADHVAVSHQPEKLNRLIKENLLLCAKGRVANSFKQDNKKSDVRQLDEYINAIKLLIDKTIDLDESKNKIVKQTDEDRIKDFEQYIRNETDAIFQKVEHSQTTNINTLLSF